MPEIKPPETKPPDEKANAADFGQMVSALAQLGVTGPDLATAITAQKTRRQNADEIKKWLRMRPRAKP